MPSFDAVSEVDMHELTNAVDQSNREVGTRFDFKGTDSRYTLNESTVTLESGSEFQLQQMMDILRIKMVKRGIDIGCLEAKDPEMTGRRAHQQVIVRQGIEKDLARKIVKLVKDAKLKVQAAIPVRIAMICNKSLLCYATQIWACPCNLPTSGINTAPRTHS